VIVFVGGDCVCLFVDGFMIVLKHVCF